MHLCVLSPQSCPTLCDSMDCNSLWSSVQEILQTRILECVAMFLSKGYSWPRDHAHISWSSCSRQILYLSVTVESLNICICTFKAQIELKKQNECSTDQKWKRHSKFQWNRDQYHLCLTSGIYWYVVTKNAVYKRGKSMKHKKVCCSHSLAKNAN